MLGRAADYGNKVVSPISRTLNYICMVVLVAVNALIVADVLMRRIFNAPIPGTSDIGSVGFSIIVFCSLAWGAVKNRHVELDLITKHLPQAAQRILEVIMVAITSIILGVMSWQLIQHAIALQGYGAVTTILEIPMYPFVYIAAFGSLIVALAFLVRLFRGIDNLRGDR